MRCACSRDFSVHLLVDRVDRVGNLHGARGERARAGWYHVRDGKIDTIRAYFDPRPLLRS